MISTETTIANPANKTTQRFSQLTPLRNTYLDRAYECAQVTIPYLFPERRPTGQGETGTTSVQHDYNTEGAKLVNNLANYYVQTLFPAGRSFVKLRMEEPELAAQEDKGRTKGDIETAFASAERDMRQRFEDMGSREAMLDLLKHLIIGGNSLIYKPKDSALQIYALDEYVTHRALDGTLNEIITEDRKAVVMLPDDIRDAVIEEMNLKAENLQDATCALYTHVIRKGIDPSTPADQQAKNPKNWIVRQSVESSPVGTPYEMTPDEMRWFPEVWVRTRREQYGRSLVEEHFGSFWVLSILTEALTQGAVTMADIKYLVKPGSMLDPAALTASASGSFHYGEPEDVGAVQRNHDRDFRLVIDVIELYKRHLGEVFMHLPSQMRDAERVTAEENHLRAQALERSHGGVFSQLAKNLQDPMARLTLAEMNIKGLDKTGVRIAVVTGFDALARGQENERIILWMRDLQAAQKLPEPVLARLKWKEFMQTTAAGRDVDHSSLIMSQTEFQEAQEAAIAQEQAQAAAQAQGAAAPTAPQPQAPPAV